MKNGRKWSLAISLAGTIGTVHAQSSVTLYGVFDQGVLAATNVHGGHLYQSSSGWLSGSRWGMRGAEDLGGGAQAIFVLENGFDGSSGAALQGGREFGRMAYVGLANPYGKLTFGRQYDMVVDHLAYLGMTSEIWGGAFACHPGDVDNLCNSRRMDNSVKYSSPMFNGLSFGAAYSLGGTPGAFSHGSIWTVGADYTKGPLSIGVGYFNVNSPNTVSYGGSTVPGATTSFTNGMSASPAISGFATANRQETLAAGANYTIGSSTVGASYSYTRFDDLGAFHVMGSPSLSGNARLQNAEVRYAINVTPFLLAGIAFHYTTVGSVGGISGARYRQLNLGLNYSLSKRTSLYAVFAAQSANGMDSTGKSAVAAMAFVSPSSSNRQAAAQIGIRHRF